LEAPSGTHLRDIYVEEFDTAEFQAAEAASKPATMMETFFS
jgi:hypothetical protein